jgi:hypothetical protein
MAKFKHEAIGKGREKSTHSSFGHTKRGHGSSPSHRRRCQDFYATLRNHTRKLAKHVLKHPNDLQAAAAQ